MHRPRFAILSLALLAAASPAAASGFGLFQHGGRTTGQAGAFTARASDPSAVTFNPAGITRLEGFQLQGGLDFNNSNDSYSSSTGKFSSRHVINFPPSLYATWTGAEGNPWSFGLGLDSPMWNTFNWDPALFPGRLLERRLELRLFELHPVLAYDMGDGWSIAGGVRYLYGDMKFGQNFDGFVPAATGLTGQVVEIVGDTDAKVDGIGYDLALHYAAPSWGWGAVLRSAVEVSGSGDTNFAARDVAADVAARARLQFPNGGGSLSFDLPLEARGGIWFAPYPELRLEADLALAFWSQSEGSRHEYVPRFPATGATLFQGDRNLEDTLSIRLAAEGDITDNFLLFGGLAFEPSPVDSPTPGFARGDALVYALGFSYEFPQISFDVGYSFHDHDNRGARFQEPENPTVSGTYEAHDQVWSASARWRF